MIAQSQWSIMYVSILMNSKAIVVHKSLHVAYGSRKAILQLSIIDSTTIYIMLSVELDMECISHLAPWTETSVSKIAMFQQDIPGT